MDRMLCGAPSRVNEFFYGVQIIHPSWVDLLKQHGADSKIVPRRARSRHQYAEEENHLLLSGLTML